MKIVSHAMDLYGKFLGQAKCLSGLNGRNDKKYLIGAGLFGTPDTTVTLILDGECIDDYVHT